MFLRNAWYAAGFSDEFGRNLIARTYLDEAVVVYRTAGRSAGRHGGPVRPPPVAAVDGTPHRRSGAMRLSRARLRLHRQPASRFPAKRRETIPAGARVRTYPVVDRHFYLWIWMGDPARADPALIPDFSAIGAPGAARHRIKLHLACNFQLVVDNLLDLSHLAYVHSTTTGNPALAEDAVVKTVRTGDTVQIKRWIRNVMPSPTFVQFGGYQGRVNLWQVSEYAAPTYVRVSYGSSDAGVAALG